MPDTLPPPLSPEVLRPRFDPADFTFETTASLEPVEEALGQTRASDALSFGLSIPSEGYNLFAMGPQEAGKHTLVRAFVERRAATEPVPPDLCYVADFAHPQKPLALRLPAGRGRALRSDVAHLVGEIGTVLPAAFETDEFRARRERIEKDLRAQHEGRFEALRVKAEERSIAVVRTPVGLALTPMRKGEAITREEFEKLPEEERKTLQAAMESLQESLSGLIEQVPRVEKEIRDRVHALVHEVANAAVGHLVDALTQRYEDLPEVVGYLNALRKDVLENVDRFLKPQDGEDGPLADLLQTPGLHPLRRYRVNLLVDHGDTKGAPVIYEDHPNFQNIIGRIENLAQFGALLTDFNLVRAGALHKANGGYLVLDARNLLLQPYAWEGLKRALLSREVRIESLGQLLSLTSTMSLEPEPIPLKVKVILIGERDVYYLLARLDPEFPTLFKVAVDFDDDTRMSPEMAKLYPRLIGSIAKKDGLLPLDPGGVTRVMEQSARLAGDAEKLSTHMGQLRDLLREATHWARGRSAPVVGSADVQRAIDAEVHRSSRVRERIVEEIARGTLLVSTSGDKVGQVNGLAVLEYGRVAFGRPSRITAKVRLGRGEVVDIEREVELGGPIHSKGVFILAGFLGTRYATEHPLSLSASLVFEQSYGFVEGDSASCAELCALLSALAEAPLAQSLAITGSVNQHGEVQAIGGVNEKIEGFFDVCRARGLTGKQGVLIPASNVKHLVLRHDVVNAVREGIFRVIPVETVDQAMGVLTGMPAGERDGHGQFPAGSVNAKVEARLIALAKRRIELASAEKGGPAAVSPWPGAPPGD